MLWRWCWSRAGVLDQAAMVQSVGRTGVCWENAVAEAWFGTLKRELVSRTRFATRAARVRRAISPGSTTSVRAWIARMAGEGLSASRIRQAQQVLRASLDQAVADGLIGKNPVTGIKVPTEPHREMRHLTAAQLHELATIADRLQPGAGVMITFLGFTGLRWGEMVALPR